MVGTGLKGDFWLHALVLGTMTLYTPGGANRAAAVGYAIRNATKQTWNIVMYKRPWGAIEYGADWEGRIEHDGWSIFGYKNTGPTYNDVEAINKFVNAEFGWASISDVKVFQQSVEQKINQKFEGTWRVHVAKGVTDWSTHVWGTAVTIGNCDCFIVRVA
jgi:hypothetical protein